MFVQALQTMPGIDQRSAVMLLVAIGVAMDAFGTAQKLACWAGVCPANNESSGQYLGGKQRKGNPYARSMLCECANAASRTRCALQEQCKSLLV